jgi:hypothetical protein
MKAVLICYIGELLNTLKTCNKNHVKKQRSLEIEDEGNDKLDKPSKLKQNTPKRIKCHISPQTV